MGRAHPLRWTWIDIFSFNVINYPQFLYFFVIQKAMSFFIFALKCHAHTWYYKNNGLNKYLNTDRYNAKRKYNRRRLVCLHIYTANPLNTSVKIRFFVEIHKIIW